MGTRTYEGFGRRLIWMPADRVARIALRHLGNGRVICIPGAFNRFLAFLRHLIPKRAYYRWVSRGYRRLAERGR